MNIALVYDRINKIGGAEQVLLAINEIWPNADLFTSVYYAKTAPWAERFHIHSSFLQYLPFARKHHELYPWLTPLAFETFRFEDKDVVLSVTSAEAKNCITRPETLHICYCLTPTRYLWSGADSYANKPGMGVLSFPAKFIFQAVKPTLRTWDLYAAKRPDVYIAISELVKKRIETYYACPVDKVIYPPVDVDFFVPSKTKTDKNAPFLVVSRFVPYKRIDMLIRACNQLKLPLLIVGNGKDERRLRFLAGNTISFRTGNISKNDIKQYYQQSRAFLFAGEEDFGIAAAEAQSCGKSVLCYGRSGIGEIIVQGKTGDVFLEQTEESLVQALSCFRPEQYSAKDCRINAERFSVSRFKKEMKDFVDTTYKRYKNASFEFRSYSELNK